MTDPRSATPPAAPESNLAAIILAGGRATRMGGQSKPLVEIAGASLLARVVAAASRCAQIIVVGPELDAALPVTWVREDPPFAGPAAGIAAGIAALRPEIDEVLLLASDLAHPERVVARLRSSLVPAESLAGSADAVVLSAHDRPQWFAGRYRAEALRHAVQALGDETWEGASVHSLLGGLEIVWESDDDGVSIDIDTPSDLDRVRAELEEKP